MAASRFTISRIHVESRQDLHPCHPDTLFMSHWDNGGDGGGGEGRSLAGIHKQVPLTSPLHPLSKSLFVAITP